MKRIIFLCMAFCLSLFTGISLSMAQQPQRKVNKENMEQAWKRNVHSGTADKVGRAHPEKSQIQGSSRILDIRKVSNVSLSNPTKASETEVILDEDFSLFSEGSETDPVAVDYINSFYVADAFTHTPGWSGYDIYQANGICILGTDGGFWGGWLNSPIREYAGKLTLSFRAKPAFKESVRLIVSVIDDPEANYPFNLTDYSDLTLDSADGWQDFEIDILLDYEGTASIQFNTYDDVAIDYIKVEREKDFLCTPTCLPASDFTPDGFRANWKPSFNAEKYSLNIYKEEALSDENSEFNTDFEDGIPEEITGKGLELTPNEGIDGSQAVMFNEVGDSIVFPYNGGRLLDFALHIKYVPDSAHFIAKIDVYHFDGNQWATSGFMQLECPSSYDPETWEPVYTADSMEISANFVPSTYPEGQIYQLYFKLSEMSGPGKIIIDSLRSSTTPATKKVMVLENYETQETYYDFTGMDEVSDYFYEVSSSNSKMNSPTSKRVFAYGVASPECTGASEIDEKGPFTANWNQVPRSASYQALVCEIRTVTQDDTAFTLFADDFSQIETGSDTISLENANYSYLDEYTAIGGWMGFNNVISDGILGFERGGDISTPILDLSSADGKYTVNITLSGMVGETFVIQANEQYYSFAFETADPVAKTFVFEDGDNATSFYMYNLYNTQVFIHDFKVTQSLKKNDTVYPVVAMGKKLDNTTENYRFENFLKADDQTIYAYRVMATYNRWGNFYQGEPSAPCRIETGEEPPVSNLDTKEINYRVYTQERNIIIETNQEGMVRLFDLSGRLLDIQKTGSSQTIFTVSVPGLYILDMDGERIKVVVGR